MPNKFPAARRFHFGIITRVTNMEKFFRKWCPCAFCVSRNRWKNSCQMNEARVRFEATRNKQAQKAAGIRLHGKYALSALINASPSPLIGCTVRRMRRIVNHAGTESRTGRHSLLFIVNGSNVSCVYSPLAFRFTMTAHFFISPLLSPCRRAYKLRNWDSSAVFFVVRSAQKKRAGRSAPSRTAVDAH